MELWAVKVLAMAIIFVAIFIPAILPLKVSSWFISRGEKGVFMLSVVACFGAGVFFGAYMMHLAPDVEHLLQEYWMGPSNIDYPMPQLMVGLGFFLLIFIEQSMHILKDIADKKDEKAAAKAYDNQAVEFNVGETEISVTLEKIPYDEKMGAPGSIPQVASQVSIRTTNSEAELTAEANDNGKKKMGAMKAIVMFVALSADCIFEGLSLGLQSTEAGVWNMVIAILSHEVVIAFMLGLELLKHYTPKAVFWLGFFYAMTNPIGISTGTALHEILGGDDDIFEVVSGILQAMCGGVFIYVTFIEILAQEYVGKSCTTKTVAIFVGFAVMALLKLVPSGSIAEDPDVGVGENITEVLSTILPEVSNVLA